MGHRGVVNSKRCLLVESSYDDQELPFVKTRQVRTKIPLATSSTPCPIPHRGRNICLLAEPRSAPHAAPTPPVASVTSREVELSKCACTRKERYRDVIVAPGSTLVETLAVMAPAHAQNTRLLPCLVCSILALTDRAHTVVPTMTFSRAMMELDSLDDHELDGEGAEFDDGAFRQGERGRPGQQLMAALGWARPRSSKGGTSQLPR